MVHISLSGCLALLSVYGKVVGDDDFVFQLDRGKPVISRAQVSERENGMYKKHVCKTGCSVKFHWGNHTSGGYGYA